MTVEKDVTRTAVSIIWDPALVQGDTVEICMTNPDNEESLSVKQDSNDGQSVITYPTDYHGKTDIVVSGSEGGEDSGQIEV